MNLSRKILWVFLFVLVFCWTRGYADDFYVIPVKKGCTCKGTLNGTRWCDNGDGTVTDLTTCLVWLKYANLGGRKRWCDSNDGDDAHRLVGLLCDGTILDPSVPWHPDCLENSSVIGDWRLPTKTELEGIATGKESVGSTQPSPFRYVQGDFYWSSIFSNSAWVWIVSPSTGDVNAALSCCPDLWPEYADTKEYVWPVREGQ